MSSFSSRYERMCMLMILCVHDVGCISFEDTTCTWRTFVILSYDLSVLGG